FSVNTVFAQLIDQVSPQAVVRNAQAAGISRPLPPYRSLALGAVEVSPLDMATVAATFAASGVYHEPTAITRITAQDGTVLYERPAPEGEQALEHDVAWQVTNALKGVIDHGTGERANLQRPMAGKTGTSQDSADAWFMGYTPDLAAAIWVGFPDRRTPMLPPRTRIPVEGGTWPAEMFARFGLRALADVPANDFAIPDSSLVRVRLDISRSCLPNPYTPPEVVEERDYLAGTEPTEVCTEPTGPPTADVPSVVGLPAAEATQALQGAGFVVTEQPEFSVALPPGFVVRQTPAPGPEQTLEDGYTATIYVSSADRTDVPVPDTLGMTAAEAEAALSEAGFIAEVTVQCPDGTQECTGAQALPGRVWEQAPSAGGAATIHSIVRLWTYPGG
ncbi:MAG TPA: PASTA domain-containing protein, partial [Egibacteraceae bacterium]|nr:PASTA domain-containing protein [Egibacteraceae bacterium]